MFGTAFGQCSDADKKALEAWDRAWGEATIAGDRAALTGYFADDFMALPGMVGKAKAIDDAVKNAEKNKTKSPEEKNKVTHDNYIISCSATTATITHRNIVWTPMGEGGKPETYNTRSVHFLEKRGGKWQAVSNAGGDLSDYDNLWYLEQDWNNAFWKKDGEWFKNNFASDFSNVGSDDGALTGKAEEIASIVGSKSTYSLVETTNMDISIEGKTARITGIFHLVGKDAAGKPFDTKIRYTDVWVKRDGRWQAWSSHGTMMKQ